MTFPTEQTLLKYSLIEWLWLNGISTEVAESAGLAWVAPTRKMTEALSSAPLPAIASSAALPAADMQQLSTIEQFNEYLRHWKDSGLAKTASGAITGVGQIAPDIMVIAEMPDDSEDRLGEAFSSTYNIMLRKALSYAGFDMDKAYLTYLSKWRAPSRRALSPPELAFCQKFLRHEIQLVAPKAILALGESVTRLLIADSATLNARSVGINKHIYQYDGMHIPLLASQKGEFLVKNPAMKKNFWFGLIEFAETLHLGDSVPGAPGVNNAEYISNV